MSYRTESAFSKALCDALTCVHIFHQRLESAETGRGIPDLYVCGPAAELWVELKNAPHVSVTQTEIIVSWRQGQQAWALEYRRASRRHCVTLVAVRDGYVMIPMTRRYVNNVVPLAECIVVKTLRDAVTLVENAVL